MTLTYNPGSLMPPDHLPSWRRVWTQGSCSHFMPVRQLLMVVEPGAGGCLGHLHPGRPEAALAAALAAARAATSACFAEELAR
jgi:hypothetical protein